MIQESLSGKFDGILFDAGFQESPYPAYEILREKAPVWHDPVTSMYIVTRFDDIRAILLDSQRFVSDTGQGSNRRERALVSATRTSPTASRLAELTALLQRLYDEHGLARAANLSMRDAPEHREVRSIIAPAFSRQPVAALEQSIQQTAAWLIDGFAKEGECDWVADFAAPLPAYVIAGKLGLPKADVPRLLEWTNAWVGRMGLMQADREVIQAIELEMEAREYFQAHFDALRNQPDGSFLSDLVTHDVPGWGRPLNDAELHSEVMSDLLVGGSETIRSALAAAMMILARNPALWRKLEAGDGHCLADFVEEVLRLESPVQGLLRRAVVDVDVGGVTIPAGSILNLRYASGNRDPERFECPDSVRVGRRNPRGHLAFGVGHHRCLGASLARLELSVAIRTALERFDGVWLIERAGPPSHLPNAFLRSLERLPIGFARKRG